MRCDIFATVPGIVVTFMQQYKVGGRSARPCTPSDRTPLIYTL